MGDCKLNARNLFQNGSFGEMDSLPTNLRIYSFVDKSVFLLTAIPIISESKTGHMSKHIRLVSCSILTNEYYYLHNFLN